MKLRSKKKNLQKYVSDKIKTRSSVVNKTRLRRFETKQILFKADLMLFKDKTLFIQAFN